MRLPRTRYFVHTTFHLISVGELPLEGLPNNGLITHTWLHQVSALVIDYQVFQSSYIGANCEVGHQVLPCR